MTNIMVDLETWGLTPGSDIRSIGAVVFDPVAGTLGQEFYVNVVNPWQADWVPVGYRYSLTRDPATEQWWSEQSQEAQQALTVDQVDLAIGLGRFTDWLEWACTTPTPCITDMTKLRFWAHGPHFDEVILAACYRAVGQSVPWGHRAPRDVRTMLEAAGMDPKNDIPSYGVAHNALDDAKAQALAVIEAHRRVLGWRAAGQGAVS